MQRYDRRQFITRMSAGLAVAGAAKYMPRAALGAAGAGSDVGAGWASAGLGHGGKPDDGVVALPGDVAGGPVIAYVRDANSGDISIFVGAREITVHDRAVAASLAHAASKGV